MALGKDELMAVALAVVGVAMSSTWSTVGLGLLEPIVRDMDYNSSAIPISILSLISAQLAQLDALQKRQAQKASAAAAAAAEKDEMSSDSADTDSSEEDDNDDSSSEEDEDDEHEVSDLTSGLSSDCTSEVTSYVDVGPTGNTRKRKRSTQSSSDDDEARLLRDNTRKMLDIYREYTVAQKLHHEAQLELHQTTLATYREVGMANAEAIGRVADAITELAAATVKRRHGSD